jgi:hypothetical protein
VRRYEAKRPAMDTEMTPLKAVVEPILMSARRAAMKAVAATALTGIEVLSLIYSNVNTAQLQKARRSDLAQITPPWEAPVSGKGPADARSRCGESDIRADSENHDDGGHHGCARSRLHSLMEDRHEWERGILCKYRVDIADA